MKKLLILLILLAGETMAATMYGSATTSAYPVGNTMEGQIGFNPFTQNVAVTSSGDWLILWGPSSSMRLTTRSDAGTWATTSNFFTYQGTVSFYHGIHAWGDSAFSWGANGSTGPYIIKKIVGVTPASDADTLFASGGQGNLPREGFVMLDGSPDSLMVVIRKEIGATDSLVQYKKAAWASGAAPATWTQGYGVQTTTYEATAGIRVVYPAKNAILFYDIALQDLYILLSGTRDTISTALFDFTTAATAAGAMQIALHMKGDTLYRAWQKGDVCWVARSVIAGTAPSITLTALDSTNIFTAADMPTPVWSAGAGYLCTGWNPGFTSVGDTTYLFGFWWADQSNLDSMDICYWKQAGAGWGTKTIAYSAVNGRNWYRLHCPPTAVWGTTIHIPVCVVDSIGAANTDTLFVMDPEISSSAGGGGATGVNTVIRSGTVRGNTVVRNRPEVIWREE